MQMHKPIYFSTCGALKHLQGKVLRNDASKRLTTALLPGGVGGGSGMAAFEEGCRLAPVQKYLHGVVCDRSHLRPDQRRHHGHLHLRHLSDLNIAYLRLTTTKGKTFERTCDMCLWFIFNLAFAICSFRISVGRNLFHISSFL